MMLSDTLAGRKIVLASGSPRRKELLSAIVPGFIVRVPEVDEQFPSSLRGKEIAEYLSLLKAEAALAQLETHEIALTSDTIVWLGNEVLNKPSNAEEAAQMLRKLSGRKHEVITAITLIDSSKRVTLSDTTVVHFNALTEKEIEYYVNNFKPFDKAGAYGIQEWIGFIGVTKIEGSYFTVMGLPVHLVYEALMAF